MTVNERVRYFRKEVLGMNQTDFANILGMKQTSVSTFEKSGATVSSQTIKSICLAFGLNEEWLVSGIGEMYALQNNQSNSDTFSLDALINEYGASDLEKEILKAYFELDVNTRRAALAWLKERFDAVAVNNRESTTQELEEQYKKSRLHSAQHMELSASNTTGGIHKRNPGGEEEAI